MTRAATFKKADVERAGLVYFIWTKIPRGRKVKIGFTTNIHKRIDTLQTASPVKLDILFSFPGTKRDERDLHKRFAAHRMHGEWFRWCPEIDAYIDEMWAVEESAPSPWDRTIAP